MIWATTAVALASVLHIMAAPTAVASPIRYVQTDGRDPANNCLQPQTPCATLQHAVDQAQAGDQIWLASGHYSGVQQRQNITQHVYISQSLTIRGGYPPQFTGPPTPALTPTVLDAQDHGRVLYVAEGVRLTLVGLQLVHGNAGSENGGGLYAVQAHLSLSQTRLSHNWAEFGGALYALQSNLQIGQSEFVQNGARLGGGAMRLYDTTAVISHSQFLTNQAGLHGGAFYLTRGVASLNHNQISHNQLTDAEQGWGGGLHLTHGRVQLQHNQFSQNQAQVGGAVRLFQSEASLNGNQFLANQAQQGAGLSLEGNSQTEGHNNAFVANLPTAFYLDNGRADLVHNTFNQNQDGIVVQRGQLSLLNTIFASQTVGLLNQQGQVTVTASLWQAVDQPLVGEVQAAGAITGTAGLAADGYHLTAVSDAIDQAQPTALSDDIDGLPRPIGPAADLGAHEWRPLTAVKTVQPTVAQPGQILTYTIHLSAPNLTGTVWLTDPLPAEVTFIGPISYSAGTAVFANGVISWSGQLISQTAVSLSWPVQLNSDLPPGRLVRNTAWLTTAQGQLPSTTAVTVIPSQHYLPIVVRP